jgi:Ca2+-binding EF-hand superfamily protein
VQRRKFTALFGTFDVNGDGRLEWGDFAAIVANMAGVLGLAPGSSGHVQIETDWRTFWVGFHQVAGRTDDGPVSLDQFLAFNDILVNDDAMYTNLVRPLAEFAIDTFDTDGDGRISYDEMKAWYRCYGITDDAVVAEAILHCDIDGDGYVTHDELVALLDQFYRSADPDAPGNWLFGSF